MASPRTAMHANTTHLVAAVRHDGRVAEMDMNVSMVVWIAGGGRGTEATDLT